MPRYGNHDRVDVAVVDGIWYGAFGDTEGRIVLVHEPDHNGYGLAIFTTDRDSVIETIAARYAHRRPIETVIARG